MRLRLSLTGFVVGLAAMGLASGGAAAVSAQPVYTITEVGPEPGSETLPFAINAAGDVVGSTFFLVDGSFLQRAFLHSQGITTNLGTLSGETWSEAKGLNAAGTAVGKCGAIACVFEGDHVIPLNVGEGSSFAEDINDAGRIVGSARIADGAFRPFVYSDGTITDLGPYLPSTTHSGATSINEAGDVAGWLWLTAPNGPRAFFYRNDGAPAVLIPGPIGYPLTDASAVNDFRQVVGSARGVSGQMLAFLYNDSDGTTKDLGTLGLLTSRASDINASGQIVGASTLSSGALHAFVYDGIMRDLNDLIPPDSGWVLLHALAINDAGQIAGMGRITGKEGLRGFLLTPVAPSPEEMIADLISLVQSFDLPGGAENSLVSKLENALKSLEKGNPEAACGQLGAFINQVSAPSGGSLTPEQAQKLIERAEDARTLLGC